MYKFGSDVEFEFTRIYPNLRPGTMLHLHDIYSPYHYPRQWLVQEKRFWNEQYFLEALLMYNQAMEIYLPMQLLIRQCKPFLQQIGALAVGPNFGIHSSSFYLKRR